MIEKLNELTVGKTVKEIKSDDAGVILVFTDNTVLRVSGGNLDTTYVTVLDEKRKLLLNDEINF